MVSSTLAIAREPFCYKWNTGSDDNTASRYTTSIPVMRSQFITLLRVCTKQHRTLEFVSRDKNSRRVTACLRDSSSPDTYQTSRRLSSSPYPFLASHAGRRALQPVQPAHLLP